MVKSDRRLAVFAHFDQEQRIDDYVVYYLKKLREVSMHIVFVSSAFLPEQELKKIGQIVEKVIVRENIGYDFMSWKVGLESVGRMDAYDELIICNDSVYGPLFPLQETFFQMDKSPCDFWGLTESHDIAYHLQSYFLVFRKSVLSSKIFNYFWEQVEPLADKQEVIKRYEVGLSQALMSHGFSPLAFVSFKPTIFRIFTTLFQNISLPEIVAEKYRKYSPADFFLKGLKASLSLLVNHRRFLRRLNPTHFYWRQCLKNRMPFIKRDLLRSNPANVDIKDYPSYISCHSDYDIDLIQKHLQRNS